MSQEAGSVRYHYVCDCWTNGTERCRKCREFVEIESIQSALYYTKRWHTLPQINSTNVGEHSGKAVSLLLLLNPDPSLNLIRAMMWHDTAERIAGDVPAPVRRANPEFAALYERVEGDIHAKHHPSVWRALDALTDEEVGWVKAIDVLELVMHCHEQVMLGNKHSAIVRERGMGYLRRDPRTPKPVLEFLDFYANQPGGPRSFA